MHIKEVCICYGGKTTPWNSSLRNKSKKVVTVSETCHGRIQSTRYVYDSLRDHFY